MKTENPFESENLSTTSAKIRNTVSILKIGASILLHDNPDDYMFFRSVISKEGFKTNKKYTTKVCTANKLWVKRVA